MNRVARLAEQPLDRPDCRFGAALGQPQQHETRLRLVAERDRLVVRRVRPGEVATDAEHVAALGHRDTGWTWRLVGEIPLHGQIELGEGLVEGALRPHDLAAVHRALAGEWHQPGLLGTPCRQGRGPSRRTIEVPDLLAGLDHGAVDVSGEDDGYLAGRDADH